MPSSKLLVFFEEHSRNFTSQFILYLLLERGPLSNKQNCYCNSMYTELFKQPDKATFLCSICLKIYSLTPSLYIYIPSTDTNFRSKSYLHS